MSVQDNLRQTSIMQTFSVLPDPRKQRNQIFSLFELISVAILGVLCGADDWVEISMWAESNKCWLNSLGMCSQATPSHDTLSRFFRFVDPKEFEKCFLAWTQQLVGAIKGVVALDGKTLAHSYDGDTRAIHIVSAFAAENQIVLGQLAIETKSGEYSAFLLLLEMLDLKEAVVTIDAAGCHKELTKKIREKKCDYVLALKGNQPKLHNETLNFFAQAVEVDPEEAGCDVYSSEEKSRGRIEKREVWVTEDLDWLELKKEWIGLRSLICCMSTRTVKDKTSKETRYYISSLPADASQAAKAIRSHWSVESAPQAHKGVQDGLELCA